MIKRRPHALKIEIVPIEFVLAVIWPVFSRIAEKRQYRKAHR